MISTLPARQKPLALVVDDDLSLRLSMRASLLKAGFDVIEGENGRQAIQLFEEELPDVVLLDVLMPEMDGFETCETIRKLPKGEYTQILMVTGLDDSESTQRAFEAGANDFVSKPLNWVMLGYRCKYMLRAGRAFQELVFSRSRLAKTQELAKIGNWEIDLSDSRFHCSIEACRLLGLDQSGEEITYETFFKPVVDQDRELIKEKIDKSIQLKKSFGLNYRVVHENGVQRHIFNQGEILFNESGEPELMLGAVQDVTQLKMAEEEIRLLAFYDGLTGLANRMLFLDRLEQEISKATRHNRSFALLFLDLDQFKRINDTLGHHVGDMLLKNVAETLRRCIRTTDTAARLKKAGRDTIARLGGDEFTILLTDIKSPDNAAAAARRILNEVPASYVIEEHDISVTTSIGISIFPADGSGPDELLKNADSAMYHAKNKGRNNFQFFKESLNAIAVERFSLENDLRRALENNEFQLYYQPQIKLATREIVGGEALIRWFHPQKGMIPPYKFIEVAEETGIIIDINKWVVREACRQNREWKDAGLRDVRVAVNLSGYQFASQNIIELIGDALKSAGLDAKSLEVEITENILMLDNTSTLSTLEQMKDLKLRIALDDFGTGYSSLSYLTSFPVDTIKIDRSFVMGCTSQPNNLVIIKAIIAMGHSLGMKIVAEGIETEEQFNLIREYGCDEAQGYFFKPPVPSDEFAVLVEKGVL